MTLPTDSTHLSNLDELIDEYGGAVESQFKVDSVMRAYVNIRNVTGTDTIVNNRVGKTTLKAVTAGVRPDADPTNFGRVSLTIDTIVLARDNQALLNNFQANFDVRQELGEDHGTEIAKMFDESFLIQAMKGSLASAPTGDGGASLNGAFGAGKNVTLASGDVLDGQAIYDGMEGISRDMKKAEAPIMDMVWFVDSDVYARLIATDGVVSKDYSGAGADRLGHVI